MEEYIAMMQERPADGEETLRAGTERAEGCVQAPAAAAAPDGGNPVCRGYTYPLEQLQSFRGRALHGQRNHLNRFCALYPGARFLPEEGPEGPGGRLALRDGTVAGEIRGYVRGGVLYVTRRNADPKFHGSAEALLSGFARYAAAREDPLRAGCPLYILGEGPAAKTLRYVDLGPDYGSAGLRKALLDLHPCRLPGEVL